MLRPILNNSSHKNLTFAYSNCTLSGKKTEEKVGKSSSNSVGKDEPNSVRLKQTASDRKRDTFLFNKNGKKAVRFSPNIEQNGCEDKFGTAKHPPTTKRKAPKKQSKNGSNEACVTGKEVSQSLLAKYKRHSCWDYDSTKWAARLEDLVERDKKTLKCIQDKSSGSQVFFNESQAHLRIGSGPDFSSVFLGVMDGSIKVAVKKVNVKRVPLLQDDAIQDSLQALSGYSCLAKVHFISKDKTQFYIVRELCENSLKIEMKMWQYVPEAVRPCLDYVDLCRRIAESLASLHENDCYHMALRPENIFVTKSGGIKLADYGIHKRNISKKQQYDNGAGALCWMPSEALGKGIEVLTKASDIASLGMVFFWLITKGSHAFGDPDNAPDTCIRNISNGHYNLKAIEGPFAHHLIQHMIFKEPKKRMTITQVLGHPYFWTEDQKADYIGLVARTVHLIARSRIECDTMSSAFMQVLKTSEASILRSCTDMTLLKGIPNGVKTDLTKLLIYAHGNFEREMKGGKICDVISTVYPGFILEIHSQFSMVDLESLISDLMHVRDACGKPDHLFVLKPCLSADSGVGSPGPLPIDEQPDFEDFDITTFPFEASKRSREDSDCYASTDDGIDVRSPTCGSFVDESVFSSPVKINSTEVKSKLSKMTPSSLFSHGGGYSSSVDNHFEFDRIDLPDGVFESKPVHDIVPWTDMDELD